MWEYWRLIFRYFTPYNLCNVFTCEWKANTCHMKQRRYFLSIYGCFQKKEKKSNTYNNNEMIYGSCICFLHFIFLLTRIRIDRHFPLSFNTIYFFLMLQFNPRIFHRINSDYRESEVILFIWFFCFISLATMSKRKEVCVICENVNSFHSLYLVQ